MVTRAALHSSSGQLLPLDQHADRPRLHRYPRDQVASFEGDEHLLYGGAVVRKERLGPSPEAANTGRRACWPYRSMRRRPLARRIIVPMALTLTKAQVAFTGLPKNVVKLLEQWEPDPQRTELAYRDALAAMLRAACPPDARVEVEYRHEGTTTDVWLRWKGGFSS